MTPPDPAASQTAYLTANRAIKDGRLDEAAAGYRTALRLDPRHLHAWLNLGTTSFRMGHLAVAVDCFTRAVGVDPRSVVAHRNAAAALEAVGDLSRAIGHHQQVVALDPDDPVAVLGLWRGLYEAGRVEEALECLKRAARRWPAHADIANALAGHARLNGNLEGALTLHLRALAQDPEHRAALSNVANLHAERGEVPQARRALDRLRRIDRRAARPMDRAAAEDPVVLLQRILLCPPVLPSTAALDRYRTRASAALAALEGRDLMIPLAAVQSSRAEPPVEWAYHGRDNLDLKRRHAALFTASLSGPPIDRTPSSSGRWRVGFVVTTGHGGVFARCTSGLIDRLDRERFDVTVACPRPTWDQIRADFVEDRLTHLHTPLRFDLAAAALRSADLDLLYHWEVGTDSTNTFLAFQRLAPVQLTGWGWPDTSGAPALDHHLTSAGLVSHDTDGRYSEALTVLPGLPGFLPRPPSAVAPSRHGLPEDVHLYVCAQALRKVHPDLDELLAGILRRDPTGLVVLVDERHPAMGQALRRRWATTVADVADRIVLLPRMDVAGYQRLLAAADMALDPRHFGGAMTTYDAFAVALPVVTWPGDLPRSRFTAALARQAGVVECIVPDAETYIERAVQIATDPDCRNDLRRRIRAGAEPLFEAPSAVTQLETFFTDVLSGAGQGMVGP